ncbi:hypothetical protein BDZ85DRAFT_272524 [Elsinoe ampelina]|uniref:Xylanolytic transcriptional activator regulatory domain-containing protein n=1 Tax=Elsinoe ampelina TaxID=302913 RepID=A0A6A6GJX3_9PEZI|nr:hypothetical protein BDZ85DRAFT_272524 [Elsinoe ampelina]
MFSVYLGDTAALSFLQFLRKTLRHYAGPSPFTESQNKHTLLELPAKKPSVDRATDDLSHDEKIELIRIFRDASSGFLYLHTDEEISSMLVASELISPAPDELRSLPNDTSNATLYIMIAIGALCRSSSEVDEQIAARYLSLARKDVFKDMLHDPSLDMVINFLLLSYAMLCACRRNTAFMYVGIASQAARILGLHVPQLYHTLPVEARNVRTRVWKCLKIMDVQCNAVLGRPGSTLRPQTPHQACVQEPHAAYRALILDANYDCCLALEDIYRTTIDHGSLSIEVAERFLLILRHWIQNLPEELRETVRGTTGLEVQDGQRELALGKIHIASSYYFGVVFITRQFLVKEVTKQLRDKHVLEDSAAPVPDDTTSHKLAQVCVDAAVCNIQTSSKAAKAGILLGNMSFLAAWQFSAALSLGFSQLVPLGISQPEISTTFASCKQVLRQLSTLSPQAQRYLELLTRFGEAIEAYHTDASASQQPQRSEYLEQIFSVDVGSRSASRIGSGGRSPTAGTNVVDGAGDASLTMGDEFHFPELGQDIDWTMGNDDFGYALHWDLPADFYE